MKPPTLLAIFGPTAVGKTAAAIEAAQMLQTEIISCDSRQMYREMQIGTAFPTAEELAAVPHHFIGNLSIHDYYNVSMYEQECLPLLERLFTIHPVVVMTGGSGLYADAVLHGIDDFPTVDPLVRQNVADMYRERGIDGLRKRLQELDPEHYTRVDLNNRQRIMKAIEVCIQTGRPYSSFLTNRRRQRPFNVVKLGLTRPRDELYERINRRTTEMINAGLWQEAEHLYPLRHLNALNTVGYKELFACMDGECDLATAIELIRRNTRRYAKRQMTWFARDKEIKWIDANAMHKQYPSTSACFYFGGDRK